LANEKATQLWFGKAREDLMTAKALNSHNDDFNTVIVFHCQQAAEKSLKGFLTHHNIRVLKTHDMEKLLTGVAKIAPELVRSATPMD
jgi:HEPN domain-containing protein